MCLGVARLSLLPKHFVAMHHCPSCIKLVCRVAKVVWGLVAVNVVSTLVAVFLVDRLGRKFLLVAGGIQMIAAEITVGVTLKFEFAKSLRGEFLPETPLGSLPHNVSAGVVAVICIFIAGFAWSWVPIGERCFLGLLSSRCLSGLQVTCSLYCHRAFVMVVCNGTVNVHFISHFAGYMYLSALPYICDVLV